MRRTAVALLLAIVGAAGCGGGSQPSDTSRAPLPAAIITISGFSFGDPVTVAVGQTVIVRNADSVAHTWTASDGAFDSGTLEEGQEFVTTFDEPGVYEFICGIHPAMKGSLTVTG